MTIGPVVLLGLLSIFFMLTTVRSSMMEEIEEGLKGTAAATLAAYDQNTGDYMESSNGDIWKGSYNISHSESLVDRIKDNTGMDVTFFYGDRRIMTSALDSKGSYSEFSGRRADCGEGLTERRGIFQQFCIAGRCYELWLFHAGLSEQLCGDHRHGIRGYE